MCLKVSEGTNVDYFIRLLCVYRSYLGRVERGVLKEGMPISLCKEMV
jgi:hypothetical protein